MGKYFVEKLAVKKVVCEDDYQEVFFKKMSIVGNSIRIYGCDKDISSMLKKSFWGCKSVIDLYLLKLFPVKMYLDGVLLKEIKEADYPVRLKEELFREKKVLQDFSCKFMDFLKNYPKKSNVEAAIYAITPIWLRAYVGTLIWKAKEGGYADDDLFQRRCSLMLDLLKEVQNVGYIYVTPSSWAGYLLSGRLSFFPENIVDDLVGRLKLQNIPGNDETINLYCIYLFAALREASKEDEGQLFQLLVDLYGVFSGRRIDKGILMEYNGVLSLCQIDDDIPNYVIEEQPTLEEIKCYLAQ